MLAKIFQFRARNIQSIEKYLEKLISRQDYAEILTSCPDRRELPSLVARARKTSEEQLASYLAKNLRLEYLAKLASFSLENLTQGSTLDFDFQDCRRLAFVPIFHESLLTAVACLDPAKLKSLVQLKSLPIYLATWSEIVRVLDESEDIYRALLKQREQALQEGRRQRAVAILQILIEESENLLCKDLTINFDAEICSYEVKISDGRVAKGSIDLSLKEELREILLGEIAPIAKALTRPYLKITPKEAQYSFALSWSEPELSIAVLPVTQVSHLALAKKGKHIDVLCIDDNFSFRKVMEKYLNSQGLTFAQRENPQDALNDLKSGEISPLVIICDLHMPQMKGDEFVRRLRADANFNDLPVMMLTSDDGADTQVRLVQDGVDVFLSKMLDPRILGAHLKRVLMKKHRNILKQEAA